MKELSVVQKDAPLFCVLLYALFIFCLVVTMPQRKRCYAYTCLLLLFAGVTACQQKLQVKGSGHHNDLTTAYAPFYLQDGHKVILNNNSRIGCDSSGRVVSFKGEGYFHLKEQMHSPFKMEFRGYKLECDHEAEFNLNTFDLENIPLVGHPGSATQNSIRVTVRKGAVVVTYRHQPWMIHAGKSVVIGQMGVFQSAYVQSVNDTLWFTGHYFYEVVDLEELAVLAKRLFNVDLEVEEGFGGQLLYDFSVDPKAPFAALELALLKDPAIGMEKKDQHSYRIFLAKIKPDE